MIKIIGLFFILVSLVSCGKSNNSDAQVKVTNGIPTTNFPAVVRLDIQKGEFPESPCTGTFISHEMVLTAAHCLEGANYVRYNGQDYVNYFLLPLYAFGTNRYDYALIQYAPHTAPAIEKISLVPPVNGDKIIVVGYGYNETVFSRPGENLQTARATNNVKRVGYNLYENEISDSFVAFYSFHGVNYFPESSSLDNPTGLNVTGAPGDSGGPMFIEGKGLVGVTSYGEPDSGNPNASMTFYSSLLHEDAKLFFDYAALSGFVMEGVNDQ